MIATLLVRFTAGEENGDVGMLGDGGGEIPSSPFISLIHWIAMRSEPAVQGFVE